MSKFHVWFGSSIKSNPIFFSRCSPARGNEQIQKENALACLERIDLIEPRASVTSLTVNLSLVHLKSSDGGYFELGIKCGCLVTTNLIFDHFKYDGDPEPRTLRGPQGKDRNPCIGLRWQCWLSDPLFMFLKAFAMNFLEPLSRVAMAINMSFVLLKAVSVI